MTFIGIGVVIVVSMIGIGEMGFNIVTCCMGGDEIRDSEMNIGVMAHTGETCWTEGDAIQVLMILSDVKEQEITSIGTLSAWFCSLGTQKKESSETRFGIGDVDDVGTLEGEATLFVSSTSGFQKKVRSVMDFVCGVTGEEMSFVGGVIQRDFTLVVSELLVMVRN